MPKLAYAGPSAIEHYLESAQKGRFIQSLKAYLGDASFTGTIVGGRQRTLEALIGLILQKLLAAATASLGPLPGKVIVGRPVHFTDARSQEDDELALSRLRSALRIAGITDPVFEFEPVAAAYAYQQSIRKPETVLIADFGGGTSDFSLLSLAPNDSTQPGQIEILGNDGVAFAGDVFDRAIVRHAVAPRLGKGSHYVSGPDKVLPMPDWVYAKLERWHYLSFLKSAPTIEIIERVQATSDAPQEIAALLNLIDGDLGYELHAQVNRTKIELSSSMESQFHFDLFPLAIDWDATRGEFNEWIQPQLDGIAQTVDALIGATGVRPGCDRSRLPDRRIVVRAGGARHLHPDLRPRQAGGRQRAHLGRHRPRVARARLAATRPATAWSRPAAPRRRRGRWRPPSSP